MKDEILKSFLTSFSEQHGYLDIKEDEQFEKFSNFNIISKLYPRDINIDDLSTGGQDDIGIDGAAIIVNGAIIQNEEEIDFLLNRNGTLDVTFAFIQSKNSSKFKGDQIGNFIFGIKSLFDEKEAIPENEQIKQIRLLKEKVYKHSINFESSPLLKLYFVTTGEWLEPKQIIGRVERELSQLDEKKLFRNKAEIEFYDAERLKLTFRELIRKSVKEITFNNHVALPDMPESLNVRQSLIGSLPVNSYLELVTNSEGKLSKGLFYDNVRDYQGGNKVNKEINETLKSTFGKHLLPLLNNGITIISKKVDKVGSKLKLSDFQIVNGCQSSHVLFENKSNIDDNTHIVVKVIETNDQDVINKIIRATNRQTEVKDEAFESLKPFHKDLEEYYKAKATHIPYPIYYERRSKEYLGDPKVKPVQVITLASQIKSYVSLVLEQPQSTHRYFGELLESNENRLFNNTKNLSDYYASSLIMNRLEALSRGRGRIGNNKILKYHIGFLTYIMLRRKFNEDKNKIIEYTSNKDNLIAFFHKSIDIIIDTLKDTGLNKKEAIRNRDFAVRIKERVSCTDPVMT